MILRYVKLWFSFLRISWMADLEFRMNIVLRCFAEFFWYGMQLSVFEVLYLHTNHIAGWSVHDMRVFMGTLFVTDVLYMIVLHENMENLGTMVKKGDLDMYLTKPVNSQFLVSFRKVSVAYILNLFLVSGYLAWAVSNLEQPVSALQILTFIVMACFGIVILYAVRFLFATLILVMQDAGNVQFIWYQFYRLATRPDRIYGKYLRYFVMTGLPVAFFASVPSRVLVEGIDPVLLVASPLMAAGFLWLSSRVWRWGLRHYASASS